MATLYGINLSPYARKVLIFAAEAGIELEHRDDVVPLNKTDELLSVSPRGKVPGFKDGDLTIGESGVICAYLERKHGPTGLYPQDAKDYARALFLEKYAEEDITAAIGPVFFNRVVSKLGNFTPDEAAIKNALEERQPALFSWLNEKIGEREFLVGDQLSIADVACYSPFVNLTIAGETLDAIRYPNLARYLAALAQRPAFARYTKMALDTVAAFGI